MAVMAEEVSKTPLLILASRSPRRAQLLEEAGYRFIQVAPPFEDPPQPEHGDAEEITTALAIKKAESLKAAGVFREHPDAIIVAADTACVGADGTLYGQPQTRAEVEVMMRAFADRPHRVVTGVAIVAANHDHAVSFADTAEVRFGPIGDQQLKAYLDSTEWRGKAGGYNLFDRRGAGWPIRVSGDETNVVGLPMKKLASQLHRLARGGLSAGHRR
jgi:septum formation protein